MNEAERQLPRYKCHKEVFALKIKYIKVNPPTVGELKVVIDGGDDHAPYAMITPEDEGYGPFGVDQDYMLKHTPQIGGYYVVYDDGYESYSPAKAFEDGYTKI